MYLRLGFSLNWLESFFFRTEIALKESQNTEAINNIGKSFRLSCLAQMWCQNFAEYWETADNQLSISLTKVFNPAFTLEKSISLGYIT